MRIAIAGAAGLVGTALAKHLAAHEHDVVPMTRAKSTAGAELAAESIAWDPAAGVLDPSALDGFDAVICLSGEPIAGARWTREKKRRILASRIDTAGLIARTIAQMSQPPRVFVCASAMGYYGSQGDALLTEQSPAGSDFLADVCVQWEAATEPARAAGVRVVNLRTGMVLAAEGGALRTMLRPFKLGLGGVVGDGGQYISWVELTDLVRILQFAVETGCLSGPVNAASPHPVTNREFTQALARAIHRPAIVPLPAFAVRALMGEMGEALLLNSYRLVPADLIDSGFEFSHPTLDHALHAALRRPS